MNIVTLRQIPEDETLRNEWNFLAGGMDEPEVFYTYEWALAVARAHKALRPPLLLLGYHNDRLAGIAALTALPDGHVEFLAASTADYCDFITSAADREEFVQLVFSELNGMGVHRIALANLPRESMTGNALKALDQRCGFRMFSRKAYACCQVRLSSKQERESVQQSLREKKSLRRDAAALARSGELRLVHRQTAEEVAKALPAFFQAHVARFRAKGATSNIAQAERQAFLSELAQLLGDAGWMRFSCLMAGEHELAWNYGFEYAGSWFWYQPTFDTAYRKYFPGFCMLAMMIKEASERESVQRVDLGLGDENYKTRLATGARETVYVTASSTYALHAKAWLRFRVAQAIKSQPRLERGLREALAAFVRRMQNLRRRSVEDFEVEAAN